MEKYNRKNKRNPRKARANKLYTTINDAATVRAITTFAPIHWYNGYYSFNSGSDVRYLSIPAMISGTEFTAIAAVFGEYKIVGMRITVVKTAAPTASRPALQVDIRPDDVVGNPLAAHVYADDSLIVPCDTARVHRKQYLFKISSQNQIWRSTYYAPGLGAVTLATASGYGTTGQTDVFSLRCDLIVHCRGQV